MKTNLFSSAPVISGASPTAEALFQGHARYKAAPPEQSPPRASKSPPTILTGLTSCSAGSESTWTAVVKASRLARGQVVIVLRIPDDFGFLDENLLALLRACLPKHLDHV